MTKIDKNINIPEPKTGMKYPFKDMEVNDSFAVPLKEDTRVQNQSIGGAISQFKKRHNVKWKFSVRKLENEMRIWRVE